MSRAMIAILALSAWVGGCGGQYVLTVPDQVALAGAEAGLGVRLERSSFLWMTSSVEDEAVQFQVAGGALRAG